MKKLLTYWAVIAFLFLSPQINGQVSVNVNINAQPSWGPAGYDYVEYYYLPDVEMYYSVAHQKYIYNQRGRWIWVSSIPSWHTNYNINTAYKVVINEPEAYLYFDKHKVKYARYKNCYGQQHFIKETKVHHYNSSSVHKTKGNGNGKGHH